MLGFVMARWLPHDQVALCLFLGCATMVGVAAVQVSPHGLAWLFMAITSSLVLLMSLNDPTQAFEIACYRTLDVAVGVSCAMVTAKFLQDCTRSRRPRHRAGGTCWVRSGRRFFTGFSRRHFRDHGHDRLRWPTCRTWARWR